MIVSDERIDIHLELKKDKNYKHLSLLQTSDNFYYTCESISSTWKTSLAERQKIMVLV